MMWSDEQIKDAWMHLRENWGEVRRSTRCVCIQCGHRFSPNEINEWLNPQAGGFSVDAQPSGDECEPFCPNCHMDYVLGDASGFPIDDERFFRAMHSDA